MRDCLFCHLVAGSVPRFVVLEDDDAVAFLAKDPAAVGHTLVVPRRHVEHLWDGTGDDVAAVARTVHAAAALLHERLDPDGLTMRQNTGEASGQRVFHLHIHLVPRWHGDGHIGWPTRPESMPAPEQVLERLLGAGRPAG